MPSLSPCFRIWTQKSRRTASPNRLFKWNSRSNRKISTSLRFWKNITVKPAKCCSVCTLQAGRSDFTETTGSLPVKHSTPASWCRGWRPESAKSRLREKSTAVKASCNAKRREKTVFWTTWALLERKTLNRDIQTWGGTRWLVLFA